MKIVRTVLVVVAVATTAILSADIDGDPILGVGLVQLIGRMNTAFVKCKLRYGIKENSVMTYMLSKKDLKGDGCGLACIAKELGYIVNGKIHEANVLEEVKKVVPRAPMVTLVQAIVHLCVPASSNETDQCKLVLSFSKCMLYKPHEMIFGNKFK